MTKIFDKGDFWIETVILAPANVPAGTVLNIDTVLNRPGRFVGGAVSLQFAGLVALSNLMTAILRNSAGAVLSYGDAMTVIRISLFNNDVADRSLGATAIIFMKK